MTSGLIPLKYGSIYMVNIILKRTESNLFGLRVFGTLWDRANASFDLGKSIDLDFEALRDFEKPTTSI